MDLQGLSWLLFLILSIAGWFIVGIVTEFAIIRRGNSSFRWTQWLWDNVAWIRKVKW